MRPGNPPPSARPTGRDKLRVLIMSQREVESYRPNANEACISITSPGQPWANISSRFRAVLRVAFHDLAGFQREDGSYPDGAVQLSEEDADRIAGRVRGRYRARREAPPFASDRRRPFPSHGDDRR
ncbi:hypothetical protein [Humibacter sp.]|uniref:hypothetical protein n=1 Tax=Humibacter sp. TaxID=1940291 RepID=UPI003F802E85